MAKSVKWVADWIEPKQRNAYKEPALNLWDLFAPKPEFFNGYERLRPVKELKFVFESDEVKKAVLYASAHGVYELSLNGQKIGDAFLAPETTNYNKLIWFQTYNVTSYIKPGKNELRILLADGWWIGRLGISGESCNYGDKLGFIGQFEMTEKAGNSKVIPVDETCKARTSYIKYSDLYIGEKWDLTSAGGKWEAVASAEYPKDILEAQPFAQIKAIKKLPLVETIISPRGELILDFGQVLAGVVELKIDTKSLAGKTEIVLEHCEVLDKEGNYMSNIIGRCKNQRDILVVDNKEEYVTFCPKFTYHGFRYVKISGISKENIIEASAVVVGTPLKKIGEFKTDNELINKLQHAIEWSTLGNMISVPTDCPQREKLGWTGDILAFAPTGSFLFDLKDFLSAWLYQLRLEQEESGVVPVVVPNHPSQHSMQAKMGEGSDSSAAWSDACVLVPLALYNAYGDKKVLKDNYSTMKKWLSYVESVDWGGRFHFGDWLIPSLREQPDGVMQGAMATKEIVAWCYHAITLEGMMKVCEVLEKAKDLEKYKIRFEEVKRKIFNDFISEDGRVGSGTLQGQYVIALRSGALDGNPSIKAKALERLVELIKNNDYCLDTGFASVPYLLDVLYDNGYKDAAYKMLFNEKQPGWLYMVKNGATTIWENWNAIHEDGTPTDSSYNHYAYGCVGDWMYRHIGGIQRLKPGFKKVRIAPDFDCGIKSCECSIDTPHGRIHVQWDENNYIVDVPEEIECIIEER